MKVNFVEITSLANLGDVRWLRCEVCLWQFI
jgi:hypothetical protein